jgi:nicotinamide-nucleotide amidase
MNCEILSVGTELLLGGTVNTDAADISRNLAGLGINVYWHTVVGDNPERLRACVEIAKKRADLIITTGGLGPTCDDLTKNVLAEAFGLKLTLHEDELEGIREWFRQHAERQYTDNNAQQAYLPEGCTVLHNDWGTAPGCAFVADGIHVVMLPGPPRECNSLFLHRAVPYLRSLSDEVIVSHSIRVFGMGESSVEFRLRSRMNALTNPTLAPYAQEGEMLLRVTAKAKDEENAEAMCAPIIAEVLETLGDVVYGVDEKSLEALCVRLLTEKCLTLAAAESCSGGLLAKRITDVPGASAVFHGGAVTYTEDAKQKFAGVPAQTIQTYTVVSREVALAMASGIKKALAADYGVGITGLAGPDGDGFHPVGTIFVALSGPEGDYCRELHGGAGRTRNRTVSVNNALDMLRRSLTGLPIA